MIKLSATLKTVTAILIASLLAVFLVDKLDSARDTKLHNELADLNKKIDLIQGRLEYAVQPRAIAVIGRNTRPTECRLENLKIDIRDASINGVGVFEPVEEVVEKFPCVHPADRKYWRGGSVYLSIENYTGINAVSFVKDGDKRRLVVNSFRESINQFPLADIGFGWSDAEVMERFFNGYKNREFINYDLDHKTKKIAIKRPYGCLVLNIRKEEKEKDLYVRRVEMYASACTEKHVNISSGDNF